MPKSMFSQNYEKLTVLVADTRRELGITQTELAMRIGKPQSFIAKVEGGERRLDIIEFAALADAMEISASDLFDALNSKLVRPIKI